MGEPRLRTLFDAATISRRIDELAARIADDLSGARPIMVVIAEGALRFADALDAALLERARKPERLVVRARRTESGTTLGEVRVEAFDARVLGGRHVLVVDDIADEGRTLSAVCARVRGAQPASLRTAVLVSKHERRRVDVALDYVGFDVEAGWVLGFGMDLDGAYRDLDRIAVLD